MRGEWWKRLAVYAVTALWAILARELVTKYGLSKWVVTGVSTFIFFFGFWLADIAGRPWKQKQVTPYSAAPFVYGQRKKSTD